MKRALALVALMVASPAFASVRIVVAPAMPLAPAVSPSAAFNPTFSMPALGASLSAPSLAVTPMLAAPAPVTVQAALVLTGVALSAASKDGNEAAVSRKTFDAAATPADAASEPVTAPTYASRVSELAEPNSPVGRITSPTMGPIKTAMVESAEVTAMAIPFAIAALILKTNMTDAAVLIPSMIGLWGLAFWAMRSHLAGVRSTVVGGWQASHDQKYRVDYNTGKPKDIRGHKYGSDRYEEYAPGPVGPKALTAMSAAAAVAAAAFLLL